MSNKQNTRHKAITNSMESIVVTFPSWSISDGNYNPFQKGQNVNFALNIEKAKIRKSLKKQCYLNQRKFSDYSFCARVIGNFSHDNMDGHFLVLETGIYKFFMHNYSKKFTYQEGEFVVGNGQIEVDYFIWGEQSYKIQGIPEIYYDFVIEKILHIEFPVKYLNANNEIIVSVSNTSLSSTESEYEIVEIENMSDEYEMDIETNKKMNDDNIAMIINDSFTLFVLNIVDSS